MCFKAALVQICLVLLLLCCCVAKAGGSSTTPLDDILKEGVYNKTYPGCVGLVGDANGNLLYSSSFGSFSYETSDTRMTTDTIFDIASVSKVVATTSAVAILYQEGYLSLSDLVTDILGVEYSFGDKGSVTVQNCLLHNAGLRPDPSPWFWEEDFGCPNTLNEFPAEDFSCIGRIYSSLMNETLVQPPGEEYVYSDLGFVTLQFVVGTIVEANQLVSPEYLRRDCRNNQEFGDKHTAVIRKACFFEAFVRRNVFQYESENEEILMPHSSFLPDENLFDSIAPTLNDTADPTSDDVIMVYTNKQLQGQVADGDCYAMGGVAGHAGVFSTVTDLGNFARQYLARTQHTHSSVAASFFLNTTTVALFTSVHNSTQSSRALGWNTNSFEVVTSLSNSDVKADDYGFSHSCGDMSAKTFMHIGYSGTCLCVDPVGGLWSVILTNRIFNCQGQLCTTNTSSGKTVENIYRRFNTAAVKLFSSTQ